MDDLVKKIEDEAARLEKQADKIEQQVDKKIGFLKNLWEQFAVMNKTQKMMVLTPVFCIIIGTALLFLVGCAGNPNKAFVQLELDNMSQLMKDYPRRIQADTEWAEITKKVYLDWLNSWVDRLNKQKAAIELEEGNK
jgi:hypothetical protein